MTQPQSWQGGVLTTPVTVPYQRFSEHGAGWWLGAALKALLDSSGLTKEAIDGLAVSSLTAHPDTAINLCDHLGLSPRWLEHLPFGGACGVVAVRRAVRAVQAGDAQIIACLAGDTNQPGSFAEMTANFSKDFRAAVHPLGAPGPTGPFALLTQQYMQRHHLTRQDMAQLCMAQRHNARHTSGALLGHKELSLDDYLNARQIAGPLHLYDCVMPCAGAEAFLVMRPERADELGLTGVRVLATAEQHRAFAEDPVQHRGGWQLFAQELYRQAAIGPADVDLVQTYDDYPAIALMQLQDLGLCTGPGPGPSADSSDSGGEQPPAQETAHLSQWLRQADLTFEAMGDNALPHNTSGGQLSFGQAGAAGGFLGLVEAMRQLLGQAKGHQVAAAKTALVSGYGMINYDRCLCSGAVILRSAAG